MNNRPIADSNILISYFTQDANFEQSKKVLLEGALLNLMIFAEVTNFIQNKYSTEQAKKTAGRILSNASHFSFLPDDHDLLVSAHKLMEKFLDNRLSFIDCFILSQAERYGLFVLSSDQKMGNYNKVRIVNPFNTKL